MSKNTMQRESRRLSFFLRRRVGELCFLLCLVISIAILQYFSNLSIAAQTGMEVLKVSQGVIGFYAVGSFLVSGWIMAVYVWVYFGRE